MHELRGTAIFGASMERASGSVSGVGVGLRLEFFDALMAQRPGQIRWLEVHPENYVRRGGRFIEVLGEAQKHWPIVTHGLTTALGSIEPFERDYVRDLGVFLRGVGTPWHSEHLCWGGTDGSFVHDLMPLPFNEEAIAIASSRLRELRDSVELPIALENISYYTPSELSTIDMGEVEFLNEVLERSDAKLLLDVNNVYVNSKNFGFDAFEWIDRMPAERVVQIHVAGHWTRDDGLRIDTHAEPVCDDVYTLLEHTLRRTGPVPVLLERDGKYPPFEELLAEVDRLTLVYDRATASERRMAEPIVMEGAR